MRMPLAALFLLAIVTVPAKADRAVTDTERARLVSAVAAQGCTGGKMGMG